MVSIVPQDSPSDLIGKIISRGIEQNMPRGVEQGYNRQLGLNALDQASSDIKNETDPFQIALKFARVGAQNPNLERSLGPLAQIAMARSRINKAYGENQGQNPQSQGQMGQTGQNPQQFNQSQGQNQLGFNELPGMNKSSYEEPGNISRPHDLNEYTAQEIDQLSKQHALNLDDPNAYGVKQAELQNLNQTIRHQRQELEDSAIKSGISRDNLPRFMLVGQQFDPKNQSQWMQNTKRAFDKVLKADRSLENAFIPGIGSALFGVDREQELDRLGPQIREKVKLGLEQETYNFLKDNYVTPTEIGRQFYPINEETNKSINKLPNGIFPAQKKKTFEDVGNIIKGKYDFNNPFVSYETALEKDPQGMQVMQNRLSDFFLNNVDDETSLLELSNKLWDKKDYDWRQFGPALEDAQRRGLKLNAYQKNELPGLETQAPIQSLPALFKDLSRIPSFLRGAK